MSRDVDMQTVSTTPIKKVFNSPNVSCRICDVNIKISGRFSKDSPSTASLFRTRKKNCAPLRDSDKENTTKRKLISQDHNIADLQEYSNNPLLRLDPNIFDEKDPKPRSQKEVRFEKFS